MEYLICLGEESNRKCTAKVGGRDLSEQISQA